MRRRGRIPAALCKRTLVNWASMMFVGENDDTPSASCLYRSDTPVQISSRLMGTTTPPRLDLDETGGQDGAQHSSSTPQFAFAYFTLDETSRWDTQLWRPTRTTTSSSRLAVSAAPTSSGPQWAGPRFPCRWTAATAARAAT
ncbi:hypothetical protein VTK73DRAFT_5093 [Phialemonium thermophilum]|uniref:Uncharacterized protein n=1 Tax=Phialemonium thermophilum TaxID=223376 RepID=A0ABR3V3G5_9PEZI